VGELRKKGGLCSSILGGKEEANSTIQEQMYRLKTYMSIFNLYKFLPYAFYTLFGVGIILG